MDLLCSNPINSMQASFFNGTHCSYSDLAAHFALDKSDRKLRVVIMADINVTAFQ